MMDMNVKLNKMMDIVEEKMPEGNYGRLNG